MEFIERLKLGRHALNLHKAVRRALTKIDGAALLAAMVQVLSYEIADQRTGNGLKKWEKLVDWFITTFPQHADWVDLLSDVVSAAVALYKAVQFFRSGERAP